MLPACILSEGGVHLLQAAVPIYETFQYAHVDSCLVTGDGSNMGHKLLHYTRGALNLFSSPG